MSEQEKRGIVIPRITKETDTIYLCDSYQAETAFEDVSNVFLFPVKETEEPKEAAEKEEKPEIFYELDYYFEHLNDGRPFFMACDTGSSDILKDLVITEYMREHPELFGRLIAVYAEGYSASDDAGKKKNAVKISEGSSDLGVVVATMPEDLQENINTRLVAWQNKGKLHVPDAIKMLPKLIIKPVTCGPDFIKKRHLGASLLAIVLHALSGAFFTISLFQSINMALLNLLMDLGNSATESLYGLTGQIQKLFESTLVSWLSMIPGIGEGLGSSLDDAAGASLDHIARYFSLEFNNFLSKLYEIITLPEGLGFLLGLVGSLLASFIMVLVIKFLLMISRHPLRKRGAGMPLAAIRSMIAIPFIVVSAVVAFFSPVVGLLIYNIVFVFEMVYLFSVLIRSADARSADRLSFLYPFFVIVALGVSFIAIAVVAAGSGLTIYQRASEALTALLAAA